MSSTSPSSAGAISHSPPRLHRLPGVMQMTGLGRSSIYRMMAEGTFPAPVRVGVRAVAWRETDLEAWTNARPVSSH